MKLVVVDEQGRQIALPSQDEIPKFIQKNRKKQKLSFQAVADHVGVTRQAVWSWENGESLPTMENLTKLVAFFEPADVPVKSAKDQEAALSQVESILGA